jgi:hypothetical protein
MTSSSADADHVLVEGSATVYRLVDIGYAIALDRAAVLLGEATRGRALPGGADARALEIRNPPLFATLGNFLVRVRGDDCSAMLSAHLYDFGVCSLRLTVPLPARATWSALSEFGSGLEASADPAAIFDRELPLLLERIASATERGRLASVSEEYRVYRIDRLLAPDGTRLTGPPLERLSDEQLVSLLVGERRRLSRTARHELAPYRFSYYEDDLTVLTWESALVVEPRQEDRDVEYVLEFANAQLLELRLYDSQLDEELPSLYDRVANARARPRLAGRFRAVLSDLQTRVADVTETVERVENALKVTNDVYLARVYAAALDLFRERAWRRGVERKLAILRETYVMLNSEAQAARAELLEIAIVVLIVAELVLALLRKA